MLTDPQRYNGTVFGRSSHAIAVSVRMLRHYDAIHAQIDAETARLALARWIDASGYRSAGYVREVTLEHHEDPDLWVTELQQPIDMTGG
jgi:hypothetical protein